MRRGRSLAEFDASPEAHARRVALNKWTRELVEKVRDKTLTFEEAHDIFKADPRTRGLIFTVA